MAMVDHTNDDKRVQAALDALEAATTAQATWRTHDPTVRLAYRTMIRRFSASIWEAYQAGKISADGAARAAQEARNFYLEVCRRVSTPEGRQAAIGLKRNGTTFEALMDRYAQKLFGKQSASELNETQTQQVLETIIQAAGRSNATVDKALATLAASSRVFWVLTLAAAFYEIGTARDKVVATVHQIGVIGGSIVVGEALGAMIGSVAGPIGTGVGFVAGGILGAWFMDRFLPADVPA